MEGVPSSLTCLGANSFCSHLSFRADGIEVILGSIPNGADQMVVWSSYFLISLAFCMQLKNMWLSQTSLIRHGL